MALRQIWTVTAEWLETAERDGMRIDWEADPVSGDWDNACGVAGLDPEDTEVGFSTLVEPRDQDTLLRSGDIVATSGPGGDVVFLRA